MVGKKGLGVHLEGKESMCSGVVDGQDVTNSCLHVQTEAGKDSCQVEFV